MGDMIYNPNNPKLKILSIDWDYFFDTQNEERAWMFPDGGNENLSSDLQDLVWASRYAQLQIQKPTTAEGIEYFNKMGVRPLGEVNVSFAKLCLVKEIIDRCRANKNPEIYICESHVEIANIFAQHWNLGAFGSVKIVNFDFHSDMYDHGVEYINCGNWFYHIITQIGKFNPVPYVGAGQQTDALLDNYANDYIWVHSPDSDTSEHAVPNSIRPYVEMYCAPEYIEDMDPSIYKRLKDDYDIIFICKSSVWSPPHLDKYFIQFVWSMLNSAQSIDNDTLINRMDRLSCQIQSAIKLRESSMNMIKEGILNVDDLVEGDEQD